MMRHILRLNNVYKGQASIEFSIALFIAMLFLVLTCRLFVWFNNCLVRRQVAYEDTRVEAATPGPVQPSFTARQVYQAYCNARAWSTHSTDPTIITFDENGNPLYIEDFPVTMIDDRWIYIDEYLKLIDEGKLPDKIPPLLQTYVYLLGGTVDLGGSPGKSDFFTPPKLNLFSSGGR